jgi:UMP-CMP kinase
MKLTVCPFSLVVFVASASLIAMTFRNDNSNTKNKDDDENECASNDKSKVDTTTTLNRSISENNNNNKIAPTGEAAAAGESTGVNLDDVILPVCTVVFVLGGPGVGKGTQCQLIVDRIVKENNGTRTPVWTHLSAGDLLRAERSKVSSESSLAQQINDCIASGKLVKSELTCQLIENAMKETYLKDMTQTYFLIDGYPRSHGNATVWDTTMNKHNVQCVIEFTCPEEIITARLLQRGISTGRTDDLTIDSIRARIQTFQQETAPIVQYYKDSTKIPVYTIHADQSIETVHEQVISLFVTTKTDDE